ncbi:unnamed protein product [Symbiodinium sp. KB8]|nr:unnamed protein product [Symbiodinium sp. KB8]
MAGRLDRGDRGDRYVRNERSRSYRDRRDAVGRDHGNPPAGNHYGNQNQGFRDRRDRDRRDRDVRDVREELPALRRQDRQEPRRESARGRPNLTPRSYDDEFRHDSRYRRGKGGHVNDRDRHDQYSDDRYVHQHPDRYAEQHDWEHHERDRFNRERYPERDLRPSERDQRLERDRLDRRPDRDPDRDRQDRQDRHGFRDERGDTASGDRGGRRRQDYDVHRHGEERHVDYREAEYHSSYNDVANHSRSRRVRKVMVKERKPDVRVARDRGEAATSGFREDEREARAETARGDYVQPGSDRSRRTRDGPADRRPKLGQRPRQDRPARDRKAREEGPRPPREQEEAPGRELGRSEPASKREAPKADTSTPKPPSQNQGPHSEEHAPEKPGEPDQAPEASGQSGAQSPEEGETGSSESSSDDCNSQADFSGSEENFAVAVAEEAQTEQPAKADKADGPDSNLKDGKTDSVMEPVEGRNGSQSDASRTVRTIPVPKHLCKQLPGLCAASQTKFDIQDKTAPFARVTVSGSEKAVETVLAKIRVLGHRSHDTVELCVAKNAQGQLHGWTQETIGRATQASATFSHDKDNLRVALKGAPAAVDKAWLLVVKVRQSWAWMALKDDGIAMLPAPLGSTVDFPQVIFSARTAPKWKITLSDAGTQLEILRLEFSAHYAEVEAATQVASLLPVQSFVHVDPAIALFGHSRIRSLSVLDFADFDSSPSVRTAACLDFRPSVFGRSHCGSAMSALDFLCSGPVLLQFGRHRLGSSLLAPDFAQLDTPLTRLGSTLVVLDYAQSEASATLRGFARTGVPVFASRSAYTGAFSSLRSHGHLGFTSSVMLMSRFGLSIPAPDSCHSGSFSLVRASVRMEFFLLVLPSGHAGFSSLLHGFTRVGAFPFLVGLGSLGFSLAVLDLSLFGSASLLRSSARMGSALLAPAFARPEPSSALRSFARAAALLLACGKVRLGSGPFALDFLLLGFLLLSRGLAHLDLHVLALGFSHLGVATLLQELGKTGTSASAFARGRIAPAPSVLDPVHLEPLSALQQLACLGLPLLVSGFMHLGSPLLLRNVGRFGLSVVVAGSVRLDVSLSILDVGLLGFTVFARCAGRPEAALSTHDYACFGSLPLVQSLVCLDFLLIVADVTNSGSSPAIRSLGCLGPTASASGLACAGLVSPLSASESSVLDSSVPLRSPAKLGTAMAASDLAQVGISMFLRMLGHLGAVPSAMGSSRLGPAFSPPVIDIVHMASPPLPQSSA